MRPMNMAKAIQFAGRGADREVTNSKAVDGGSLEEPGRGPAPDPAPEIAPLAESIGPVDPTEPNDSTDTVGRIELLGLPASSWRDQVGELGVAPYRGEQLARWVFHRRVFELGAMTNLPAAARTTLASRLVVAPPELDSRYDSVDGTTRHLLRLRGGDLVESVRMPYEKRVTYCISSQVGCRFGCEFCQTARLGLIRSLSAAEIVGQVLRLSATHGDGPAKQPNIVFMGQGEPLDNLPAVTDAVVALQDEAGPGLSWRRLTVSTVGIVPAIAKLAELGPLRPRLAVSLNSVDDEVRDRLMPVNRKYPIDDLLGALRAVRWRRRERVTIEYVLLAEVTDEPEHAKRLARLLGGLPVKVNLIPWNPIASMPFRRPSPRRIEAFRSAAAATGLDALVRYSRGADIGAACGQLHAEHLDSTNEATAPDPA